MNRKPHSLDISCSYSISNKKTIRKLGKSKLEGYIVLKDNKSEIRLPMRSFVKQFLDKLHDIFAGENNADISKLTSASVGVGASITKKAGILLGNGLGVPTITSTNLSAIVSNAAICDYKGIAFQAPYSFSDIELRTRMTRLITNASSAPWVIREVGLKTKKTASTASNTGTVLNTIDAVTETFQGVSDKIVALDFSVSRSSENGGAVLNLLRLFYNLYLHGSENKSTFLPRVGTVTLSHASASATSALVMDAIAGKFWGVVVGKYVSGVGAGEEDSEEFGGTPVPSNPPVSPDEYAFEINVTDLTYGIVTVTAVIVSGTKAYFTVSRDITNNTTIAVLLNRIGLLSKGATTAPTTLQNDQIFMMVNRSVSNISLAPNQTIRVDYKFEIEA